MNYKINPLDNITKLEDLLFLAQNAIPEINFWGKRIVYISSDHVEYSVDIFSVRIAELINEKQVSDLKFSDQECNFGERLSQRVNHIYKTSDSLIEEKNYFTQVLCALRDLWSRNFEDQGYPPRFFWDRGNGLGDHNFFKKELKHRKINL